MSAVLCPHGGGHGITAGNVAGSFQAINAGQTFQPLVVRVMDSANPPNPVLGAGVLFQNLLFLPDADESMETAGETATGNLP